MTTVWNNFKNTSVTKVGRQVILNSVNECYKVTLLSVWGISWLCGSDYVLCKNICKNMITDIKCLKKITKHTIASQASLYSIVEYNEEMHTRETTLNDEKK